MGRPKKEKKTVTILTKDVQALTSRMGYKTTQDLLDDLAMGLIPPTANALIPSSKLPTMEGSSKSEEVTQPSSLTDLSIVHADSQNQVPV